VSPETPEGTPSYESLLTRAGLSHALGQTEEALRWVARAQALDPARSDAWRAAGVLLDALGRTEEAIAAWRHALARNDRDREAWVNLAFVLGRRSPAEGIDAYRALLSRWPDDPAALHNLQFLLDTAGAEEA